MFDFQQLCDTYDALSPFEKRRLLTGASAPVLTALRTLSIPGLDAVSALAGFLIGSVTSDGRLSELKYLLIYPSLVRIFGDPFDFTPIKARFRRADSRAAVTEYTRQMITILDRLDDGLRDDVILLCLCIAGIDGRISRDEKQYILTAACATSDTKRRDNLTHIV